ncbi:hypothetical protein BDW02DRAFT_589971 [Decorospora gaudefroyi]|uniref:Galactosyl transferase GMA12/MNN10 family protein n=1 Tax=Decorospora gaudefroyi TaxID=184978 RepID=A0A6A5KHW6_9PLEO|nr:hypothetical protein BDW02DRAFT_589971 [Decorospora gaudefroyi]
MYISPSSFKAKPIIWDFSVPYSRPHSTPVPQFVAHGESQCLPEVTPELIEAATAKHAACRKYSPFVTGRARIATVTAHFGKPQEHYRKAFQTHLLHALVHGTEIKVLCDPIVGDLWNKPAFILNLLTREMMKPEKERLEWIQWADRDTLILDQCRPITSFLPPETSRTGSWWRREDVQQPHDNTTNLLVNKDHNGLNNGVFFLRVNNWAIDLFTAILAFTHYKPEVPLPFTEQSAMEQVLNTPQFKDQARYVPQHWFNGYPKGGPLVFKERENLDGLDDFQVRRGDYLVHFAGHGDRAKALPEWTDMLEQMEDVWKKGRVQRDIGEEVKAFWRGIEAAR